jgi:glycerophosphoryl diester phosphodiesterase
MFAVAEELDAWSVNISRQIASRELIDQAHDQGYRVLVYTVNDHHEAERLKDWGVDGLFTDRPDLLR